MKVGDTVNIRLENYNYTVKIASLDSGGINGEYICHVTNQYYTTGRFPYADIRTLEVTDRQLKRPICIGEHVVEFKPTGVQVGCTFVSTATVDEVYKRLHEERK